MSDLTVVSLFDGIGGFPLAFEHAGAKTVATVEIDKAAAAVSARHFPDATHFDDVTKVSGDDLRSVGFIPDRGVITAGFPCFTAGTPVLTGRGFVPIEQVAVGDIVLTHRNRWRTVTATMSRNASVIEFLPGFYCTPEHRLWTRQPGRLWHNDIRRYRRTLETPEWIDNRHGEVPGWANTQILKAGYPKRGEATMEDLERILDYLAGLA